VIYFFVQGVYRQKLVQGEIMTIRIAALAALACWSGHVWAASPAIAITGSITQFGYTFESLDPNASPPAGGLASFSLVDEPTLGVDFRTSSYESAREFIAAVDGMATSVSANGIMRGSVTPASFETSLAVSQTQLSQLLAQKNPDSNTLLQTIAGSNYDDYVVLKLAAHTAVTFTGTIASTLSFDRDALDAASAPYLDAEGTVNLMFLGGGRMLTVLDETAFGEPAMTIEDVQFERVDYRYMPNGQSQFTRESVAGPLTFSRTVRNTHDVDLDLYFMLHAGSDLSVDRYSFSVDAGAVPEPGTWALMGLGLIGLAAASQRHRQPA
jgi:hypothetical protein